MASWLVHIEAVDFAATLYDTDDLSTIRGASLAYLALPGRVARQLGEKLGCDVKELVAAASFGLFSVTECDGVTGEQIDRALGQLITNRRGSDDLDRVRPHLSFSWAVVPDTGNYREDLYRLQASVRVKQLQKLTLDVPPSAPGRRQPCEFDRKRPAPETINIAGLYSVASASVATRRRYGAKMRHDFYRGELGAAFERSPFEVTQTFQDIVAGQRGEAPAEAALGIPASLANKMAVVYLDGNQFTRIRDGTIFAADIPDAAKRDRHREFSDRVRQQRRVLLGRLTDELRRDGEHRLRFETLLWGGDEAMFVMPGWAAIDALSVIMRELGGWNWEDGYVLSHAVGAAICNVKTPIAVSSKLAKEIAEAGKPVARAGRPLQSIANVLSIQVFESVEPPREDVEDFRRELYGTGAARAFTLIGGAEVQAMLDLIRDFQDEPGGLPRSQLYGLIREARRRGPREIGLFEENHAEADEFLENEVRIAFERGKCEVAVERLRTPALGYSGQTPLLPLIRLAELWDYVDPFGRPPGGARP